MCVFVSFPEGESAAGGLLERSLAFPPSTQHGEELNSMLIMFLMYFVLCLNAVMGIVDVYISPNSMDLYGSVQVRNQYFCYLLIILN